MRNVIKVKTSINNLHCNVLLSVFTTEQKCKFCKGELELYIWDKKRLLYKCIDCGALYQVGE